MVKPFSLTLAGVIVLIGLGILAAVFIGSENDPDEQRFLILIGIIGTTVTALLAVVRAEANATRIEASNKIVVDTVDSRATQVAAAALAVEARVAAAALVVEQKALRDLAEVKAKIDENTQVSVEAFRAANNYAERLSDSEKKLNAKFERLLGEAQDLIETTEQVQDREAGDIRRTQDRKAGVVRRSEQGDDA